MSGLITYGCLRVKLQEEIKVLERARNDMQVEETFVHDKYKQIKAENERLQAEINKYRSRLGNATEDYVSTWCASSLWTVSE